MYYYHIRICTICACILLHLPAPLLYLAMLTRFWMNSGVDNPTIGFVPHLYTQTFVINMISVINKLVCTFVLHPYCLYLKYAYIDKELWLKFELDDYQLIIVWIWIPFWTTIRFRYQFGWCEMNSFYGKSLKPIIHRWKTLINSVVKSGPWRVSRSLVGGIHVLRIDCLSNEYLTTVKSLI